MYRCTPSNGVYVNVLLWYLSLKVMWKLGWEWGFEHTYIINIHLYIVIASQKDEDPKSSVCPSIIFPASI